MTKKTQSSTPTDVASPWGDETAVTPEEILEVANTMAGVKPQVPKSTSNAEYDLEGLMTDFPTAKELERFVFDETGVVLNLKGRANKLKYQTAMDVLNGEDIDPKFIGSDNPYIDRTDMVPVEAMPPVPERDKELPPESELQNYFLVHLFRIQIQNTEQWVRNVTAHSANIMMAQSVMKSMDHGNKKNMALKLTSMAESVLKSLNGLVLPQASKWFSVKMAH